MSPEEVVPDDESPEVDDPLSLEEESDIRMAIRSEVSVPTPPLAVVDESAAVEEVVLVAEEESEEVLVLVVLPLLFSHAASDA